MQCAGECQYADGSRDWNEEIAHWPSLRGVKTAKTAVVSVQRSRDASPTRDRRVSSPETALKGTTQQHNPLADRVVSLEARIAVLEACLASATDTIAAERSARAALETQFALLQSRLDSIVPAVPTAPSSAHALAAAPAQPAKQWDPVALQASQHSWLDAHVSRGAAVPPTAHVAPTVPRSVTHVVAKPYLRAQPAPSLDELVDFARKQALEARWATFQPGTRLSDVTPSSSSLSAASSPVASPAVAGTALLHKAFTGVVAPPYTRGAPPSDAELAAMRRHQGLEGHWHTRSEAASPSTLPYAFPLHDVA